MERRSLVPVLRVRDAFHARVVVARLTSEGIIAQLRGADGPYPMGVVEVLVLPEQLEAAQALLLADEVESAFPGEDEELGPTRRPGPPRWAVAAAVAILSVYVLTYVLNAR
ncbi:MAG: hypothetical protein M3503_07295 [Actinomycetota bacterium]|nr:hypothetical protein [Actinomycetota bacterium]